MNAGSFQGLSPANLPPQLAAKKQQEQNKIQALQVRYAGVCGCAAGSCQEHSADDFLQKIKAESESHIVGHERAHQAGNPYAGGMVIDRDSNGVAVSGHVDIAMPGLNPLNPEEGYKAYGIIRNSALAPGDPSGQDMAVASQASSMMGQAKVLMDQKKQAQQQGLPPGKLSPQELALAAFSGKSRSSQPQNQADPNPPAQGQNPSGQTDLRRLNPLNIQA